MAASAIFTVNGSVPTGPVLLTENTLCTVALVSTSGASDIRWMFTGASETVVYPTITKTGFSTATFTVPANPGHGAGLTLKLVCTNTGDEASALICVGTTNMIASNETTERGALGWAEQLNTNFRATVTGRVEFATHAAYRAAAELADGTFFTIVSPPGEWRYSASSGAGFTDDDRTILKRTGVLDAANGRAFSTRAGATVPTFDALRGLRGSNQDHVHVQAHTTFGDGGGGIFDRAAIGSYVDDEGTVATAGSNAWVRRGADEGPLWAHWFGARGDYHPWDGTGGTADAAAVLAMLAVVTSPNTGHPRPIRFRSGIYKMSGVTIQATDLWDIRGVGKGNTILYWPGTGTGDGLRLGVESPSAPSEYQTNDITLKDFWIAGDADCGRAALYCPHSLLEFDIDLYVTGGWTYGYYQSRPGSAGTDAAMQWGTMRLSNVIGQGEFWATQQFPDYMLYNRGYINACRLHVESMSAGVCHVWLYGEYSGADAFELSGTVQGGGIPLYAENVGALNLHDFYTEGCVPPQIQSINSNIHYKHGAGPATLDTTSRSRFRDWTVITGHFEGSEGNTFDGPSGSHYVDNLSHIWLAHGVGVGAAGRRFDDVGAGLVDPQNIFPNGNMVRWNTSGTHSGYPAGLHAVANYTPEKCGVGCTDTTRTIWALNCLKMSTTGAAMLMISAVQPSLPAYLVGSEITFSFKARRSTGTTNHLSFYVGEPNLSGPAYEVAHELPADNGFTLYVCAARITTAMTTDGWCFEVRGNDDGIAHSWYVSEIQVHIANNVARYYTECDRLPAVPARLLPTGEVVSYVTAEPTEANDPIFGYPWQDGDRWENTRPTVQTNADGLSFFTAGGRRIGGAWVNDQHVTGLVPA